MGISWRDASMFWRSHVDGAGNEYSLNHLHAIEYEIDLPAKGNHTAKKVHILVGFGLHCFTRECQPADLACEHYRDDREVRTFDHDRYELSKNLPGIARSLSGRKIMFAKNENYTTIDVCTLTGVAVRYGVFFNLRRLKHGSPGTIQLIVQSAYRLDPAKPEPGKGKVGFNVLLNHALQGTRPTKPR